MKNLTNKQFLVRLRKLNACIPAVDWVEKHGGSAADCWRDCDDGSWMGWLIGYMKLFESPQKLALCLADIIKPCSKILPEAKTVEKTLRLYMTGEATIEQVKATGEAASWAAGEAVRAARAARAAGAAEAAEAAGEAARAAGAAEAAEAAEAASWAARAAGWAASWAARAAGWAARAAGWTAGEIADLKRSANVFRKHYPSPFTSPTRNANE
jgi:hypothetical protein